MSHVIFILFSKCPKLLILIFLCTRIIQFSKELLSVGVLLISVLKCWLMLAIITKRICGVSECFAINLFVDIIPSRHPTIVTLWKISNSSSRSLTLKTYQRMRNHSFQLCWLKIPTIEQESRKLWPTNI